MRKVLLFAFLFPAIIACNKSDNLTPVDDTRLLSVSSYNDSNKLVTLSFSYDAKGRIISAVNDENGHKVDVSYSGNEVFLTSVSETLGFDYHIRYILDEFDRPARRFENTYKHVGDELSDFESKNYLLDTTDYYYDSEGLLARSDRTNYDSTWNRFSAGTYDSRSHLFISSEYTNSNRNLSTLKIAASYYWLQDSNYTRGSEEYTYSFEYDKNYGNIMDFKNAAVLAELEVLTMYPFPLNKNYANFPNKVTETFVKKDGNGVPEFSSMRSYYTTIDFDQNGRVIRIDSDSINTSPVILQYSR